MFPCISYECREKHSERERDTHTKISSKSRIDIFFFLCVCGARVLGI